MNELIQEMIQSIDSKIERHEGQVKSLLQVKRSLQNVCKHEFSFDGKDHVYEYEKCIICTLSRKAE